MLAALKNSDLWEHQLTDYYVWSSPTSTLHWDSLDYQTRLMTWLWAGLCVCGMNYIISTEWPLVALYRVSCSPTHTLMWWPPPELTWVIYPLHIIFSSDSEYWIESINAVLSAKIIFGCFVLPRRNCPISVRINSSGGLALGNRHRRVGWGK